MTSPPPSTIASSVMASTAYMQSKRAANTNVLPSSQRSRANAAPEVLSQSVRAQTSQTDSNHSNQTINDRVNVKDVTEVALGQLISVYACQLCLSPLQLDASLLNIDKAVLQDDFEGEKFKLFEKINYSSLFHVSFLYLTNCFNRIFDG